MTLQKVKEALESNRIAFISMQSGTSGNQCFIDETEEALQALNAHTERLESEELLQEVAIKNICLVHEYILAMSKLGSKDCADILEKAALQGAQAAINTIKGGDYE